MEPKSGKLLFVLKLAKILSVDIFYDLSAFRVVVRSELLCGIGLLTFSLNIQIGIGRNAPDNGFKIAFQGFDLAHVIDPVTDTQDSALPHPVRVFLFSSLGKVAAESGKRELPSIILRNLFGVFLELRHVPVAQFVEVGRENAGIGIPHDCEDKEAPAEKEGLPEREVTEVQVLFLDLADRSGSDSSIREVML